MTTLTASTDPLQTTSAWLLSWLTCLNPLHADLLRHELGTRQRRGLGGHLLPIGPGLVMALGQALSDRPELFPDAPATGPALIAGQEVATRWLMLSNQLQMMAQLASDAHTAQQAHLNTLALGFINQ